jgi:hypothetical protein
MRFHFAILVSASNFIQRQLLVMWCLTAYALYISVINHAAKYLPGNVFPIGSISLPVAFHRIRYKTHHALHFIATLARPLLSDSPPIAGSSSSTFSNVFSIATLSMTERKIYFVRPNEQWHMFITICMPHALQCLHRFFVGRPALFVFCRC